MSTQNLGFINSKSYNNKDNTRQSVRFLRNDAYTHVVYNVGQFWAEMLKSFAVGKSMNLHNIVLNQFLP